jgi:hypothetical protein
MSIQNEHGANWDDCQQDGFQLVYKRYEPKVDQIATVYYRHPAYRAILFEKVSGNDGEPLKWTERRPSAVFNSLPGAIDRVERMLTERPRYTNTIVDLPPNFDSTDSRGVRFVKGDEVIPTWTSIVGHMLLASISLLVSGGGGAPKDLDALFGGTLEKIRVRKTLLKLKAVDAFAAQFGISAGDVRRIADDKRVMPQININGMDYYNPDDFGDMTTLLQPSSAPSSVALLQPASATTTSEETLLRSSQDTKLKSII